MTMQLFRKKRLPYLGLLLCDAPTGYVHPALSYTRSGAIYLPNESGALTLCPADTPCLRWNALVGKNYGVDPGFTNYFLNSTQQTGVFVNSAAAINDPSGEPMRKAVPVSGALSFPAVSAAAQGGASALSLAQGATQDFWYYGYIGPSIAGSNVLQPNMVLEANLSGTSNIYCVLRINPATGVIATKAVPAPFTELQAPVITAVGGGVYFFSWGLRFTQNAILRNTIANYMQILAVVGGNPVGSYTSDGVAGVQFSKINCVRASYQPPITNTTTAAVTIGNPSWSASLAGLGLSAAATAGTLGFEANITNIPGATYPFPLSLRQQANQADTNTVGVFQSIGETFLRALVRSSGVNQFYSDVVSAYAPNKRYALAYAQNRFAYAIGGIINKSASSGNVPSGLDTVFIGSANSTIAPMQLKTAWLSLQVASDAQLRAVTA